MKFKHQSVNALHSGNVRQMYVQLRRSMLIKNSFYLMSSAIVLAVLGFGFWFFVAHIYAPAQIGLASALIAITAILTNISMLGVNSGLMRFLAKSRDQSRDINAAIIIVASVTAAVTVGYLGVSEALGFHNPLLAAGWEKAAFVLAMVAISVNSMTDAVFVANRRAEFHTAGYAMLGAVKLVLPVFFVTFGAVGIFASYIGAVLASLILSFILMRYTCSYRLAALPDWSFVGKVRKYAMNNYVGVLLGGLASQLMPLLVLHRVGAADVAFFSIAWTMANLIYVIPSAVSQSMLAESSHDIDKKSEHIRNTIKIIAVCLAPVVIVSVLIAPHLLSVFGARYALNSSRVFQVLAIAAFPVAVNEVCGAILNIEHRSAGIVVAQFWNVAVTIAAALYFLRYGLVGAGIALALGSLASNLSHLIYFTVKPDRYLANAQHLRNREAGL